MTKPMTDKERRESVLKGLTRKANRSIEGEENEVLVGALVEIARQLGRLGDLYQFELGLEEEASDDNSDE